MRVEMVTRTEFIPWPSTTLFCMVYERANVPPIRLHFYVGSTYFQKFYFSPQLLILSEEFERLTTRSSTCEAENPTADKTPQLLKDQRKDLFSLGTLLDTVRDNSISKSPSAASTNVQDFVALCQNAKSIDQLVDHKYLTQSSLSL